MTCHFLFARALFAGRGPAVAGAAGVSLAFCLASPDMASWAAVKPLSENATEGLAVIGHDIDRWPGGRNCRRVDDVVGQELST